MTRAPVRPVALLPLAAFLWSLACAGAEGRDAAAPGPAPAETVGKGPTRMHVVRNEKAVETGTGERIDLVVTRSVGIPEQLQVEWPAAPSVEGDAVRFVGRRVEAPPPEDDGGVTTLHYELEAVRPGVARVTLAPRPASRGAARPPVVLEVTVRSADARAPLPELVRALVSTVAGAAESPLEVGRRFGTVESDSEGGVYVKPADSRLRRVIVVRKRDTGELNDVQIQLAEPGALSASELVALWGAPGRPPTLAVGESKLVFRPPAPAGAPYRATVALTLDGDENGPVTWVDVIRDVR